MQIAVIGAGLAGLSCGIHLLNRGFQVQIFEKNDRVGGRANRIEEKGYKIDMGPTLVLMPEVLEELFLSTGHVLCDYVQLKRVDPAYRINFGDGQYFDLQSNLPKLKQQVTKFAPGTEKVFKKYLRDVENKFESSRLSFIERNFESFWEMVNLESLVSFLKIKPFGNAYDHVYGYFKNDHVAAALSCQCLYLGQSPKKTPSLYNLLAYLEIAYGVWYPVGGVHTIAQGMAKLFEEMGGTIRLNADVESIQIEKRRATGVKLKNGTIELADAVVSNRDLPASYLHFVDEKNRPSVTNKKVESWNVGCSACMFYFGINKKLDNLQHHNIMLAKDYKGELERIFEKGELPEEPLLYVCVPTKTDPSLAPEGHDILYILALVPNLQSKIKWDKEIGNFRKRVLERLRKHGVEIQAGDIELERIFTPEDFKNTYGNHYGNAFGLAPDFFQSAAFRPATKSKDIQGLFHVGASTHPGGGIPMVTTCGKLVAEQIWKEWRWGTLNDIQAKPIEVTQ